MKLTEDPEMQPILFGLFLTMYLITVVGNMLIILVVTMDMQLHLLMYFFLLNLSLAYIWFVSATVPKLISDIRMNSTVISYVDCLVQMSINLIFVCMDDLLLTVITYDRFVAICQSLHYTIIMNPHFCVLLFCSHFWVVLQTPCYTL
jgi:olfactory receptor